MLKDCTPCYDFSLLKKATPASTLNSGFLVEFHCDPLELTPGILFEIPGSLICRVREVTADNLADGEFDRKQHYLSYRQDGKPCLVMEVALFLVSEKPDWKEIRVGIPLTLLKDTPKTATFAVAYTGGKLLLLLDGRILDENFPYGNPAGSSVELKTSDQIRGAVCYRGGEPPVVHYEQNERKRAIQYYSPFYFNAWVGDVVCFYHAGRFHIFYLFDRRHHSSRFYCGAHYFAHLSSTDLRNWEEHEPAVELDAQWQTCGTGTPFFHNGKYYYAHGWHTNRMISVEKTFQPLQEGQLKTEKCFVPLDSRRFPDVYPSGATYSVSDDGIHFVKSGMMINYFENPSIYTNPDDTLTMYVGAGTWSAKDINSPWTSIDPSFPESGPQTPMRQSCECPSFFDWNGWKYLLMGVTGFLAAGKDGKFIDQAALGYDIYEGLAVPMVAPFTGNRMIYAGWINGIGWGSVLVFRELLQHSNGRLGMKWLPEVMNLPSKAAMTSVTTEFDSEIKLNIEADEYFELEITPGDSGTGKFVLRFLAVDEGGKNCELQLDFGRECAQWGTCSRTEFAPEILPIKESLKKHASELGDKICWYIPAPDLHFNSLNFAIGRVDIMKKPFTLRLYKRVDPKMPATLLDVEIAGARTMITNRVGARFDRLIAARHGADIRIKAFSRGLPEA
jgi:hypothetical protein